MSERKFPDDVHEESWCRLPLVKREDLTEGAKAIFDEHNDPNGDTHAGMRGPGGVRLHSPHLAELARPVARYLRHQTGLSTKIREVAIPLIFNSNAIAAEFTTRWETDFRQRY